MERKAKIAKAIRIISVPPVMVTMLILILVFYKAEIFRSFFREYDFNHTFRDYASIGIWITANSPKLQEVWERRTTETSIYNEPYRL